MPTNAEYTNEYFDLMASFNGDIQSRRDAFEYMQNSTAIVHHEVVACTFVPRLFNQQTYDAMKQIAETAHRILCKVMQHYLDDAKYRLAFDYDPRLEELILIPRGYESLLPIARVDTFFNEDSYEAQFCEFNGDGSSGMNENREVTQSLISSRTFEAFAQHHHVETCELFDSWVDTFMRIYNTYERRVEHPRVAIVDYLENGMVDEFNIFCELFNKRGINCTICDVRELSFDGKTLMDNQGKRIDAVWRRCVTNDVLTYWDESQPFLEAVRAGRVALIGSFAGHIVHDKQLFAVLHDKRTTAFLDDDEVAFIQHTVPQTFFLDDEHANFDELRKNRKDWIIKPTDHYGADKAFSGASVSQEEWEDLLRRYANNRAGYRFIAQRYITPFRTNTLPPDDAIVTLPDEEISCEGVPYNNLNGLYLYDGVFKGVFSRLGPQPVVSKDTQGITAATIWVDVNSCTEGKN